MSNDAVEQQDTTSDDVLWGAKAIAEYVGLSLSEVQYLIRTKKLPIGKLGPKTLFASKRQLRQHLTPKTPTTKESAA
jgi:hypothetical protein